MPTAPESTPTRLRGRATDSAAVTGNATCRDLELLPRLPWRRIAQVGAMPGLRIATIVAPRRTRHAIDRARRLRRVLCHDREARRSFACRRAGHCRRRAAWRGGGGVLRRPHLRREIGDADVRGVATLPASQGGPAQYGEILASRPRSPPDDAGTDSVGRAAVDRRGFSRSVRHRATAWHVAGEGAGALCPRRREGVTDHGLDRTFMQQ